MKAIQITVDDALLARLDADSEVKALGRSAVFRRAVEAYLRQRRRRDTADAYRKAYGGDVAVSEDLHGWADEGVWPEK
jgi:metal-responsive CopG/Arc/MetJ family transcriptional regulator